MQGFLAGTVDAVCRCDGASHITPISDNQSRPRCSGVVLQCSVLHLAFLFTNATARDVCITHNYEIIIERLLGSQLVAASASASARQIKLPNTERKATTTTTIIVDIFMRRKS